MHDAALPLPHATGYDTVGAASLRYSRFLWRLDDAERVLVRLGPTGEVYVAADGRVTDNFPNNRPTNPYPWTFIRFPETKQGLQLARFDVDSDGVPSLRRYAFIFNQWSALQGPFVDRLTDLRVLPSGAPVLANITYETGPPTTIARATATTFYRSGELLAERSEFILDPHPGGTTDRFLVAPDSAGNLYAAFQRLRAGTGPDLDLWIEQIGSPDPGTNTPPAFSANDVTVVMPSYYATGAFVNGFSYFYYDAEDGTIPASGGCDRPLGSFFPLGSTTVTCTFTDSDGLSVAGTFQVNVTQPLYDGAPFTGLTATPPDSTYNGIVFRYTPVTITATAVDPGARALLTTRLDQNPPVPPNLQAGSPPMYFELDTTRAQGPYTVCIDTTGMSLPKPATSRLYHFARPPISDWLDITSSGPTSGGQVCGTSPTLGTFAIFYAPLPETAIRTIAGNGTRASSIDGPGGDPADDFVAGPAPSTPLAYLFGGAYDRARNLLFFSDGSYILRLNLNTNRVDRVAGNGAQIGSIDGPGGDPRDDDVEGGHPFNTYVGFPWQMIVDSAGDLVFFDRNTCRLRRLDRAADRLFSVAGNGTCGNTGDGFNALSASISVSNLAYDASGNLFFSDRFGMVVRRIDRATNVITTVAGDGTTGMPVNGSPLATLTPANALAFDRLGHLIVGAGMDIVRISPGADGLVDGSADETMAVLLGCHTNCVAPFGGDGLAITDPKVFVGNVDYLMVADDGAVIFSDNGRIRRIAPGADGVVTKASDETMQTIGGYYDPGSIGRFNGDTFATQSLLSPFGGLISEDAQHRLLIVDTNNFRVRRFGFATAGSPDSADIQVSAQDTPDPIVTGARLDYTVRLENFGPAAAAGMALTYTVPSGAEFHSVTGSPLPSCVTPSAGGTGAVTCEVGSLASGAVRDLTISVTPRTKATLPAQFAVTSTSPDANPVNNTWSLTTTVEIAPAVITIEENIAVADAISVLPSAMLLITEQVHVTDGPQVSPSVMLTIDETVSVSDSPAVTPGPLPDATPPRLELPSAIRVPATGPLGTLVFWPAAAFDDVNGSVPVTCNPASSALFPIGTATVSCSASDAAGNTATGSFPVTVFVGVPSVSTQINAKFSDVISYVVEPLLRNVGTGNAINLTVSSITFRTLQGAGTVTLNNPPVFGPLPLQWSPFNINGTFGGSLRLQVPTTVQRFSITFSGSITNAAGVVANFSNTVTVIR